MWVKSRIGSQARAGVIAGITAYWPIPPVPMVVPSGAALASSPVPIAPPAPARFSHEHLDAEPLRELLRENPAVGVVRGRRVRKRR